MLFKKKVQFLNLEKGDLQKYSFLDIETNLPFDIFSPIEIDSWKKLEQYTTYDLDFILIRVNDSRKGLCWKVKAGAK